MMDLTHDAELIRLYLTTYRQNGYGVEAPVESRLRVLDALQRLEAAAKVAR